MSTVEQWQYDEMKQIGTDYEDQQEVADYDKRMSEFRDIENEIQKALDSINIKPGHIVAEIGTGTGSFAIEASRRCKKVFAVDISKPMLEFAKVKAEKAGISNIEFIHAGFLTVNISSKADAVVSQIALHHLSDFWKQVALKRIYDMLVPGGIFYLRDIVFSFNIDNYDKVINNNLEKMHKANGPAISVPFANHIRNEHSTFDWIMEEMIYRAGFYLETAEYSGDIFAEYICRKTKEKYTEVF